MPAKLPVADELSSTTVPSADPDQPMSRIDPVSASSDGAPVASAPAPPTSSRLRQLRSSPTARLRYLTLQTLFFGAPLFGLTPALQKTDAIPDIEIGARLFSSTLATIQLSGLPCAIVADRVGARWGLALALLLSGLGHLCLGYFVLRGPDILARDTNNTLFFPAAASFADCLAILGAVGFLGVSAPLQIIAANIALQGELLPKISDTTVAVINGSYDASGIVYTLLGLPLIFSFEELKQTANSRADYFGGAVMVYGLFGLANAVLTSWWFAGGDQNAAENGLEQERRPQAGVAQEEDAKEGGRTSPRDRDPAIFFSSAERRDEEGNSRNGGEEEAPLAEVEDEAAPPPAGVLRQRSGSPKEIASSPLETIFPPASSGTRTTTSTSNLPPRTTEMNPHEDTDTTSLLEKVTAWIRQILPHLLRADYILLCLWFGFLFYTFSSFLGGPRSGFFRWNAHPATEQFLSLMYPFSLLSGLLIGRLFDRFRDKRSILVIASFLGFVFQLQVWGFPHFSKDIQWTMGISLCFFRSGLFSSTWVCMAVMFEAEVVEKHLGTLFGFAGMVAFGVGQAVDVLLPDGREGFGEKRNGVWLAVLGSFLCLYCGCIYGFGGRVRAVGEGNMDSPRKETESGCVVKCTEAESGS